MPFDFDRIAKKLEKFEYADAVLRSSQYTSISWKDERVDSIRQGSEESFSCRVFARGAIGFASTNQLEKAHEALARAEKLAKARRGQTRLAEPEAHDAKNFIKPRKAASNFSLEEKIRWLKDFASLAKSKKVFRVQSSFSDAVIRRHFTNSVGSRIFSQEPRIAASMQAFARENGGTESSFQQIKYRAGVETLNEMHAKAEKVGEEASLLLTARHGPKGRMAAVLDPELAGVMAHEAVGHACEADEIQSGSSILKGRLGMKIGSPSVVIRDSPVLDNHLWGSYAFDDEGSAAKESVLVKAGVLNGFLTSLETAGLNRGLLSGNARAEPGHRPIVRMSNTYFGNGNADVGELFESVKSGVYLIGCKEGQVSPKSGNFTFAAKYGYVIKNGEKTSLLKDCSINGNILESLKHVTLAAEDLEFAPGTCGKEGQGVPVTTGSPHLLIKSILVG